MLRARSRWARSQECHQLCRIVSALRRQEVPEAVARLICIEAASFLMPRGDFIAAMAKKARAEAKAMDSRSLRMGCTPRTRLTARRSVSSSPFWRYPQAADVL
mmetsp:Transcript_113098/g.365522  ORF Transcript_113098/g.365522 Transcript_113098/m.365522 type:complete len:103 (+) Transcript_113098:82-390(+)